MQHRTFLWVVLFLVCIARPATAQQGKEYPVEVLSYAEDTLGERLIYRVKEEFRESSGFRMASPDEVRFQLMIQTMELKHAPGESTAYSVTWVVKSPSERFPKNLDGILGYCTEDRIEGVAENVVAQTDEMIAEFIRAQ